MRQRPPIDYRVGTGFDVHRFATGRRLIIGGVEIDHPLGLDGHSDADVLAHAIMDALLGAAGSGDIGYWFPPGDPQFAGADSLELARQVTGKLMADGWRIANVDATIVAQRPKIAPYVEAMRAKLADALQIEPNAVGIKATTPEYLGALGREEGIAAQAVALIWRSND